MPANTDLRWVIVGIAAIVVLIPIVVMLLVGGAGGYLIYRGLRRAIGHRTDPAIEELRQAYARGDLTDEEFEQRRERLQQD